MGIKLWEDIDYESVVQVVPGQTAAPGQTLAPAQLGGASGVAQNPKTGALTPQTPIPVLTPKPGTSPVTSPLFRSSTTGLATAAVSARSLTQNIWLTCCPAGKRYTVLEWLLKLSRVTAWIIDPTGCSLISVPHGTSACSLSSSLTTLAGL